MKAQPFNRRLRFALRGLKLTAMREKNFRAHLFVAAAMLMVMIMIRPAAVWWAIVILAIGMVLVTELVNTALETLADRVHPEQHPEIGAAKDIAAGAVLVAGATAAAVGLAWFLHWLGS
ncbi:MAG: diacylglycerol kinase [Gammaproteobacteria bacterium]|nr:diacylglycerol kinase [Gammaproteobacteria bacterium]